jgi:hypothetical protein
VDVTTVPMACVVPVSLGLGSRAAVPKALGCRYKSDGRAGAEAAAGASTSCRRVVRRVSVSATLGAAGQGQRGGGDGVSNGGRGVGARGVALTARAGSAGAGAAAGVVQLPGLGADGQTWDPLGLGERSRRPHVNRDLGVGSKVCQTLPAPSLVIVTQFTPSHLNVNRII